MKIVEVSTAENIRIAPFSDGIFPSGRACATALFAAVGLGGFCVMDEINSSTMPGRMQHVLDVIFQYPPLREARSLSQHRFNYDRPADSGRLV